MFCTQKLRKQCGYMYLGTVSVNINYNLGTAEDFQECTNRSSEIGRSVLIYLRIAQHANRFYVAKNEIPFKTIFKVRGTFSVGDPWLSLAYI